jgi:uncharacterized protein
MTINVRFVADTMLGKLAKWLRLMGFDVSYHCQATAVQLLYRAGGEDRILLTRDHSLIACGDSAQRFYVESDYYHLQVRQVVQAFDLTRSIQAFTRCSRCNTPLVAISKRAVVTKVPAYVYATQTSFKHCLPCDHVYWGGTHRANMIRQLRVMLRDVHPSIADLLR